MPTNPKPGPRARHLLLLLLGWAVLPACETAGTGRGPEAFGAQGLSDPDTTLARAMVAAESIDDVFSRLFVYTTIADGYIRADRTADARVVLERALRFVPQTPPDSERAEVLAEIARQLIRADDVDAGVVQLRRSLEIARNIEEEWRRGLVLQTIVDVCFEGGERTFDVLRDAIEAVYIIEDVSVRSGVLIEAARQYQETGIGQSVETLVQQSIPAASSIENPWLKAERYTEIALRYFVAQERNQAARFADRAMEEIESVTVVSRIFDDTVRLLTVSRNLARLGRFADAVAVASTIELPHLQARALVQIADVYSRAGATEAARALLDMAVRTIETEIETFLLAESYAEIAAEYARLGDETLSLLNADYALELAPEIEDPYQRSAVIERVIDVYLNVDDYDRAREALALVDDPYIQATVMVDTATALAQRGDVDTAGAILDLAEDTASRATYLRDELYRNLAIAYLEVEDSERSLQMAAEIEDGYALALALAQIGRSVLAPQTSRGRETLASIERRVRRTL